MGIFSNIIQAAATVFGGIGVGVDTQDGPHFTVRVVDADGQRIRVTVSVIGSGDLEPADHLALTEYQSDYYDYPGAG